MKDKLIRFRKNLTKVEEDSTFLDETDKALNILIRAILNGRKVLVCGNGGSATQASHMVGELIGRFKMERNPLPAISLFDLATTTAVSNDYGYDQSFSRFVTALGKKGDVLFSISTSGNSSNCLKAMEAAKNKDLINISLIGGAGGKMGELADTAIVVSLPDTPSIQEVHLMVIHYLCEKVEENLFNKNKSQC